MDLPKNNSISRCAPPKKSVNFAQSVALIFFTLTACSHAAVVGEFVFLHIDDAIDAVDASSYSASHQNNSSSRPACEAASGFRFRSGSNACPAGTKQIGDTASAELTAPK
jgi:hypothetical protein